MENGNEHTLARYPYLKWLINCMKKMIFLFIFLMLAVPLTIYIIYGNRTEIKLSGIDMSIYPTSAEYVLVNFHGHDVINKPEEFSFYQNKKDQIIAKNTVKLFNPPILFVVKGNVKKEDIEVTPVHNNYSYGGSYILTDDTGKIMSGIKYTIHNKCNSNDSYTGITGNTGKTVLFTTSKPCDINIELPQIYSE